MYWMYIQFFGKKQAGKDVPKMCRRINQRFPNIAARSFSGAISPYNNLTVSHIQISPKCGSDLFFGFQCHNALGDLVRFLLAPPGNFPSGSQ